MTDNEPPSSSGTLDELVELGRWAKQHAIPALKITSRECDRLQMLGEIYASVRKIECDDDDYDPWYPRDVAENALAALPDQFK